MGDIVEEFLCTLQSMQFQQRVLIALHLFRVYLYSVELTHVPQSFFVRSFYESGDLGHIKTYCPYFHRGSMQQGGQIMIPESVATPLTQLARGEVIQDMVILEVELSLVEDRLATILSQRGPRLSLLIQLFQVLFLYATWML